MGMAASQARLLSITARLSDNEMKQQSLTYAKQKLADNSAQINDQYLDALDKTKYQVLTGYNGTEACYEEVSYNQLTGCNSVATGKQYLVKDTSGKVLVSNALADAFKKGNGDFNKFLAEMGYTQADIDVTSVDAKEAVHQAWDKYLASVGKSIDSYNSQHIFDFGYQTFSSGDMYDGYPTYDAGYAIVGNNSISVYKEKGEYYTPLQSITVAFDSEGEPVFYAGDEKINDYAIHYDKDTGKFTYQKDMNDPYQYDNDKQEWIKLDMLYAAQRVDGSWYVSSDPKNTYTRPTNEDGTWLYPKNAYKDELGNQVTLVETTKALNYDGTTMAQRELYDYALAITEKYYSENNSSGTGALVYDVQMVNYYRNIFNQMATCGYTTVSESFNMSDKTEAESKLKDANWFVSQLKAGKLVLSYYSASDKEFKGTTLDSDGSIVEKEDKSAIALAEQVYTKKMDEIERQDKMFDLELNRLESEHNALQTEYDSVKKVISKNVDSSFKTFS